MNSRYLTMFLAVLSASVLGCSETDTSGDGPSSDGSDVTSFADVSEREDDAVTPDTGGATGEDGAACEPVCDSTVCGPDGCGGFCSEACEQLPSAYGTSCRIEGTPDAPTAMTTENALPNLIFNSPTVVRTDPSSGAQERLLVVEKRGVIKRFEYRSDVVATDIELFLDISQRVDNSESERGLLGLAFHPDFQSNGWFYVNYTGKVSGVSHTIVSRFTVDDGGLGDPSTEVILLTIEQPFPNHNGGDIAFGPDGYLYIGVGDGGAANDPFNHGQNTDTLLGTIVRIDVDTEGADYGIPDDNPFADGEGGRPEIFAWGLRNPWRLSFDTLSGQLWVADVGQDAYEEVHIVEAGKNYGWKIMEGMHCFPESLDCDQEGLELPVLEYDHSVGESITGGFVYRGDTHPNLFGAYLYADYVSGAVFAARYDSGDAPEITLLTQSGLNVSTFGATRSGDILVTDFPFFTPQQSVIHRLVPQSGEPAPSNFPLKLSDTGCFTDLESMTPSPGLVGYAITSPLWHDGARSERYLVLPDGGQMMPTTPGAWTVPDGTRIIKTFAYDAPDGSTTRVETRFLLRDGDDYRYYSYRWNEEQTDATLLSGAAVGEFTVGSDTVEWHYPSRSQCASCHNEAAGHVLGFRTGLMNREFDYGPVSAHQFDAYDQLGVLGDLPDRSVLYPAPDDPDASLTARTRAALLTNCATCHRQGGPPTTDLELRFETPLDEMNACDVEGDKGDAGVPGAKLITPGNPDLSTLVIRMELFGTLRMPNIGSEVLDTQTIQLTRDWISSLEDCTPQ